MFDLGILQVHVAQPNAAYYALASLSLPSIRAQIFTNLVQKNKPPLYVIRNFNLGALLAHQNLFRPPLSECATRCMHVSLRYRGRPTALRVRSAST